MVHALKVNANIRLHRIMNHVKEQLVDFGSTVWSTNDINEKMHKDTKEAFKNTNKRPDLLVPQLLTNRSSNALHAYSQTDDEPDPETTICANDCHCQSASVAQIVNRSHEVLQKDCSLQGRLIELKSMSHENRFSM